MRRGREEHGGPHHDSERRVPRNDVGPFFARPEPARAPRGPERANAPGLPHHSTRRPAAGGPGLLAPGIWVVITSGQLAGLTGRVIQVRENGRILIAPTDAPEGIFLEIDRGSVRPTG